MTSSAAHFRVADPQDLLISHEEDVHVSVADAHRMTDAFERAIVLPGKAARKTLAQGQGTGAEAVRPEFTVYQGQGPRAKAEVAISFGTEELHRIAAVHGTLDGPASLSHLL